MRRHLDVREGVRAETASLRPNAELRATSDKAKRDRLGKGRDPVAGSRILAERAAGK